MFSTASFYTYYQGNSAWKENCITLVPSTNAIHFTVSIAVEEQYQHPHSCQSIINMPLGSSFSFPWTSIFLHGWEINLVSNSVHVNLLNVNEALQNQFIGYDGGTWKGNYLHNSIGFYDTYFLHIQLNSLFLLIT